MKEIIKQIIEVDNYKEDKDSWGHMAGFKVITNQQEILLLIDDESSCCEQWGYFWSDEDIKDFIGFELLKIEVVDTALDKEVLKKHVDVDDSWFEGGVMFVNFETNRGTLQFTAYNNHNGYYGHEAKIISKQLNHSEFL